MILLPSPADHTAGSRNTFPGSVFVEICKKTFWEDEEDDEEQMV